MQNLGPDSCVNFLLTFHCVLLAQIKKKKKKVDTQVASLSADYQFACVYGYNAYMDALV